MPETAEKGVGKHKTFWEEQEGKVEHEEKSKGGHNATGQKRYL